MYFNVILYVIILHLATSSILSVTEYPIELHFSLSRYNPSNLYPSFIGFVGGFTFCPSCTISFFKTVPL